MNLGERLAGCSTKILKDTHRYALHTEPKARDRKKLATKIARAAMSDPAVEKRIRARLAELSAAGDAPKSGGTSIQRVADAARGLDGDQARELLASISELLVEERQVREEKRVALRTIRESITEHREALSGAVAEWREHPEELDAGQVVARVEKAWRQVGIYEGQAVDTAKDYTDQISDIVARIRGVLDSITQPDLPGIE